MPLIPLNIICKRDGNSTCPSLFFASGAIDNNTLVALLAIISFSFGKTFLANSLNATAFPRQFLIIDSNGSIFTNSSYNQFSTFFSSEKSHELTSNFASSPNCLIPSILDPPCNESISN